MKLPIVIVVTALVCALATLTAAQRESPAAQTNMAGAWELNREASSPTPAGIGPDPGAGGHGGHPGGGRGGFGGPGMGGMGGHGGPGGAGTQPDKQEMQRMRDLTHEVLVAPTRLVISQDGDVVSFTDDEGRVRRYTANGKEERHQLTSGTVETKTRWEDGALVMELEIPHGMKLSRHFAVAVAGDAKQLVVSTEIAGGDRGSPGGKHSPLKAVYDPAFTEP